MRVYQVVKSDVTNLWWVKWQTVTGYVYKDFDRSNYYAIISQDEYARSSVIRKGLSHKAPFSDEYYLNVTKTGEFMRYKEDALKIERRIKKASGDVRELISIQEQYENEKAKEQADIRLYIEEKINRKELVQEKTEAVFEKIGNTLKNGVDELIVQPIKTLSEAPIIAADNVRDNSNKVGTFLANPTNKVFVVGALVTVGFLIYTKRDEIKALAVPV